MQFTTVAFVLASIASASATLVARQSPYPDCANPCLASADLGGCQFTDTACLCKNANFIATTTACIEKACQGDDLTKAFQVSQAACAAVGAPLTSAAATSSPAPTPTTPSTTGNAPATSQSTGAALGNNPNSIFGLAVAGLVALAL
ncbi:hypothetical protein CVT24_001398 [Panaeolus cyanescens]|uniref:CFEM domain-containing protein n=1 Tax=Panaeolus cyanescens TaxID=181874 RepID=A0A409WIS6_9AGAR|nr:hypothetical protein CVT24_001398 [Panaeolus cyanescens]